MAILPDLIYIDDLNPLIDTLEASENSRKHSKNSSSTKFSIKLTSKKCCKSLEKFNNFDLDLTFDKFISKYDHHSRLFKPLTTNQNAVPIYNEPKMNAYLVENFLDNFFFNIEKVHKVSNITHFNNKVYGEPDYTVTCCEKTFVLEMKLEKKFNIGGRVSLF